MSEPADLTPPTEPPGTVAAGEAVKFDVGCVQCGYNLRGLPSGGNCPECGVPIEQSVVVLLPVVDEPLTRDVACIRCSYNLRGLKPSGNCPECGMSIDQSLRGFLLRFAAPEYIKALRDGLLLVLIGLVLTVVLTVASVPVMIVLAPGGRQNLISGVMQLVMLIPGGMMILGYWKYTIPDPGFVEQEQPHAARKVLRVATVVSAGARVLSAAIAFLGGGGNINPVLFPGGPGAGLLMVAMIGASLVNFCAWIAQFFAAMKYTSWIASRVPDAWIQQRARTYMWLLPLIFVPGTCVLYLGPIVSLVMYWHLLYRLFKRVKSIQEGTFRTTPPVAD